MCGIVGLMTKNKVGFTNPDLVIFEQMLYADNLRGHHGTGMFWDNKKGDCSHIRGAMSAPVFLADVGVRKSFGEIYKESSFVVGHNRWATKGAHTNDNTHPFNVDAITLIHNGTVQNHRKIKDVEVDSHAICHSISENGAEEAIKGINGAFALVWHDSSNNTLNFIRNSQRPLYMIKSRNLIALSSEAKLADWIFSRNSEKVESTEMCEVGRLYQFDPETREITSKVIELYKPDYNTGRNTNRSYSTGYWQGQKWIPYSYSYDAGQALADAIADAAEEEAAAACGAPAAIITAPMTYLPKENPLAPEIHNFKNGDKVLFTPLGVDPSGNGFKLTLIVQGKIEDPNTYAQYYNGNKQWINNLLNYHTVEGEVQAIRCKKGKIDLVIKNVMPKGEIEYYDGKGESEPDPMKSAYNVVPINGVVH